MIFPVKAYPKYQIPEKKKKILIQIEAPNRKAH